MSDALNSLSGTSQATLACLIIVPGNNCVPNGIVSNQKLRLGLIPTAQRFIIDGTANSSPTEVEVTLVPLIPSNRTPTNTDKRIVIIPISTTEYYTVEARSSVSNPVQYEAGLPIMPYPGTAAVIHRVTFDSRGIPLAKVVDIDDVQLPPNTPVSFYCKDHLGGNPNDSGAYWVAGDIFWDEVNRIEIAVISTANSAVQLKVKVRSSNYSTTCW
jgi:hypothetical protein